MFIPLVSKIKKKKMLDLHYMRNIVRNVEVGKQEESQKTRAQPHRRTQCFSRGFSSRSLCFFSLQR